MKNTKIKSISVTNEFEKLAFDNRISWTEAARVGMSILLADKGIKDYDTNLGLYRKMKLFQDEATRRSQEAEALLNEINRLKNGNTSQS
jgi:hypothetical protein